VNTIVKNPNGLVGTPARPSRGLAETMLRYPVLGPLAALCIAVVAFALTTDTFFTVDNLSLVAQQSLVVATLALGQTLIILTAGIDLANAAIMVLGTLVCARLAAQGTPIFIALLMGVAVCTALGSISGGLVTGLKLPPFIVTLGMLTIILAGGRLYSVGTSWPVTAPLLGVLGEGGYLFGQLKVTYGMMLAAFMFAVMWFALSQTAWGKHVYALGNDYESARLTGIHVRRTMFSVYVVAGAIYGIAAWQALGRIPNADPNAFQTGNLDSITAVVIGGTSLFGGRGRAIHGLLGGLVIGAIYNGLYLLGLEIQWQLIITGLVLLAAVSVDSLSRK